MLCCAHHSLLSPAHALQCFPDGCCGDCMWPQTLGCLCVHVGCLSLRTRYACPHPPTRVGCLMVCCCCCYFFGAPHPSPSWFSATCFEGASAWDPDRRATTDTSTPTTTPPLLVEKLHVRYTTICLSNPATRARSLARAPTPRFVLCRSKPPSEANTTRISPASNHTSSDQISPYTVWPVPSRPAHTPNTA
jgi:hypothetical protein